MPVRKTHLFLLFLSLLLLSCVEKAPPPPVLPETRVLSLRNNWGVISLPYFPLYERGSLESDVMWVARQGDIFEVLQQNLEKEFLYSTEDYWYLLRHESAGESLSGWAFGAGFQFFSTLEEARTAAAQLSSEEAP